MTMETAPQSARITNPRLLLAHLVEAFGDLDASTDGGDALEHLQGIVEDARFVLEACDRADDALTQIRLICRCEGQYEQLANRSPGDQLDAIGAVVDAALLGGEDLDSALNYREGWAVFNADSAPEIQRDDEVEAFESDEDAVRWVRARAAAGSLRHLRAIELHDRAQPGPMPEAVAAIDAGIVNLRSARDALVRGGASARCVDRVRASIASAEGARRHAWSRSSRSE